MRIFKVVDDDVQESSSLHTIDDPMIKGKRERHDLVNDDLTIVHDRPVLNPADAQDPYFGIVYNRRAISRADHSVIGDRKSASSKLGEIEFARSRLFSQHAYLVSQLENVFLIRPLDRKYHQAIGRIDRDADIVEFFDQDLLALIVESCI